MDGNIPTLTGLDGDTWASQLMILHQPQFGRYSFDINFDFSVIPGNMEIGRVEVTLFNCAEWGAVIRYFRLYNYIGHIITTVYPSVSSCDSLQKLCVPVSTSSSTIRRLYFSRYSGLHRVHIAEIAFYNNSSPCPYSTIIPGNPPVHHTSK